MQAAIHDATTIEIAETAYRHFRDNYKWDTNVRAVAVRAIDLVPKNLPSQYSLFVDSQRLDRRERLEDSIEELRQRFGKHSVTYAPLLGDLKMPDDRRHKVKMPGMMYK